MTMFQLIKKHRYIVAILILVIAAVFYLRDDIRRVSLKILGNQKSAVSDFLQCDTKLLDPTLLAAKKNATEKIRLLVHFTEKPSSDVDQYLAENGVILYPNTRIYDYEVAETTIDRLCFLAGLSGIKTITLGEAL